MFAVATLATASPLLATLTANDASGSVQFPPNPAVPFSGATVTFSALTDTTAFSALGQGWVATTPIVISVPGLITAPAAVPTSGLAGGTWDATTGYIEFEVGSKMGGVSMPQGAFAYVPTLLDYNFQQTFGPASISQVQVGKLLSAGDPMVVTTTTGAVITMTALSTGSLSIILPASDVSVSKSAKPSKFVVGMPAEYDIVVTNSADATASATSISVSDVLPPSVSLNGYSGTGWVCSGAPQLVCTYAAAVAPGSTAAPLVLNVSVPSNPGGEDGNNSVTVSADGDATCASGTLPPSPACVSTVLVSITEPAPPVPAPLNAKWIVLLLSSLILIFVLAHLRRSQPR